MAHPATTTLVALAGALLCSVVGVGGVSLNTKNVARHGLERTDGFRVVSFPEQSKYELIQAPRGAITTLPADLSHGTLMAFVPTRPVNDELLLFLAGTTQACDFYIELLETLAQSMRVLCLPYDNRKGDFKCIGYGPSCYAQFRFESLDGDYLSIANNSIEDRFINATAYLIKHDDVSWGKYLESSTGTSLPRWSSLRVVGHSLGSSNAAMIGYAHSVARVVQIAGNCDQSYWPERMAPPLTPSERWFALGHANDTLCSPFGFPGMHWVAEGILQEGETPLQLRTEAEISPSFLGAAQAVVSYMPWPFNCSGVSTWNCPHDSIAGAVWGGRGNTPYPPVWKSLAGL